MIEKSLGEHDWSNRRVLAALREVGVTLKDIADQAGTTAPSVREAMFAPSNEARLICLRIIAKELRLGPHEIWPSIFDEHGESKGVWIYQGQDAHEIQRNAEIGHRLRDILARVGGLNAFAEAVGIGPRTLRNYAYSGAKLPLSRAVLIARAAGVSLKWLATGEGPGPAPAEQAAPTPRDVPTPTKPDFEAQNFFTRVFAAFRGRA